MVYWPGSSRDAGKLKRPSLLVTTVVATVEPAFLAVTRTPSIGPSWSDVTTPVSDAAPWASDKSTLAASTKVKQTLASSAWRIRILKILPRRCSGVPVAGKSAGEPSPGKLATAGLIVPLVAATIGQGGQ